MRGEVQFRSDKLAVLIDADNTSPNVIEVVLREITKFGTTYIKRIYGDWTSPQLGTWKKILNDFAIVPVQQFSYTTGKNSTDSALIIDAMDLLYTDKFDGFCIVSSDSDFTRLAHRIRQDGVAVYGFGRRMTPKAFVAACDQFTYTELLNVGLEQPVDAVTNGVQKSNLPESLDEKKQWHDLLEVLKEVYESVSRADGLANIGTIGYQLLKLDSAFDARNYGYKKLGELMKATGIFEVKGNDVSLIQESSV